MNKTGFDIFNDPFLNKGTAFTDQERKQLDIEGLLPPYVQTLDQQVEQTYQQVKMRDTDLSKRLFLMDIFNENRVLFFKLFSEHVSEFMPIVYDPTIADTIENYSRLFIDPQNAAYLSINDQENIGKTLKNAASDRVIKLIVVTDGQGILGIGDWGLQGVDIAVGKLMVYTAAAGLDPKSVLPVILDVGTDNKKLLEDNLYLGNRQSRVNGDEYYDFVDKFVEKAEELFPGLYLHFEDFGRDNAANILNKYKDKILTFNDDIQGTGIITLAGIIGALNISKQKLTDQVYLSFGAGTAGAGILKRIYDAMVEEGLSEEEAKKRFYMVDKQGLLFTDTEGLTPEQKPFARDRNEFKNADQLTDLLSVVKTVHPTIMVGTSTQKGAFTKEVVQEMAAHTKRPIIFPLSNPTKLAEATAEDLINWTNGNALIATGIPAAPVKYNGVTYQIGQANNALVYPGLGLGALAVNAKLLSDGMINRAAHSLGGIVDTTKPGAAVLPPVTKLDQFSLTVAQGVADQAIEEKLSDATDAKEAVNSLKWEPKY